MRGLLIAVVVMAGACSGLGEGGTGGGSAGGTGGSGGRGGGVAGGAAAGGSAGGAGTAGGSAAGASGGSAGGSAGSAAGGASGGTAGGSAGGAAGGRAGGSAGGVAGGRAGGSAGGRAGGSAGGTAGGSAGGTAGGRAGGTAGGSAGGTAGGSAGGAAGGSAGGAAGGSAGGAAGGLVFADAGTYGNPVNGFPMWRERTISVLTNAVRISPVAYKQSTTYGNTALNVSTVLDPGVYPARAPLYWDLGLNQSSRQHSQEMADFNYFAHTSLDGGSPFVRIAQYYTRSGTLGENIAAGTHGSEVQAMIQWLCDAPQGSSPCCVDGQNCDGHRASIMSNGFHAMGSGYGFSASSTYDHYWTQDFGGLAAPPAPPLVDGTHLLIGNSSTRFIANFYATAPAQAVKVVIDGVQNSMAVDLGDATRGTWFVLTTRGTACRSYYFLATTSAGLTWRYPAAGAFRTRGEGQAACTEEYLP